MRSAQDDDLTTRARIRDAAITLFATHGFARTTVRAIAAAAGVSPALVLHHFGSKDGLRAACDAHISDFFAASVDEVAGADLSTLAELMSARPAEPLHGYVRQALVEGGPFARRFFDGLVEQTRRYLVLATERGDVRSAGDDTGRALALVVMSLGTQLLADYLAPPGTPAPAAQVAAADRVALPLVELLTHGLFTDSRLLDGYLAHLHTRQEEP
ncbi:TetR/AcrR family transcriptional regulator [Nakamurella alba]|nr:TetR family transcriptional regulator [Nakamurella alba]